MKLSFDVKPLVGPLPIRFGMTEVQLTNLLGEPKTKALNGLNEPDWDYGGFSVRFDAEGQGVVEVGYLPESELLLFGIDLFRDPEALAKVVSHSDGAFEDIGFIVIPSLGLTFTGFHTGDQADKAITVFRKGRWDRRKDAFIPYAVDN